MIKYQKGNKIFTYKGDNEKGQAKLESDKGNIRYVSKQDLKVFYKKLN